MADSYTIEKGIPIPAINRGNRNEGKRRGNNTPLYPLKDMEVGDSFLILTPPFERSAAARRATLAFKSWVFRQGKSKDERPVFTTRVVDDGVRVWRTR